MADKLRPEDLQAFKGAFDMFDKNQDGTISTKVSKIFWALSKFMTPAFFLIYQLKFIPTQDGFVSKWVYLFYVK